MISVFVTQTGSKYHANADMRCLENASGTAVVPLETAVAGGLRPCTTCDAPPVPESTEGDRQWLRAIDDWARAGVFDSFWEQAFARRVLASTPGISADDVEPQCYITVGAETYKVDFSLPKTGLVLEVDGYAKDGAPLTPSDIERRNRRDAALQTHGLTVLHFSNAQVQQEPQACRAQIAGAVAARNAGGLRNATTTPWPATSESEAKAASNGAVPAPDVPMGAKGQGTRTRTVVLIGLAAVAVLIGVGAIVAVNSGSSNDTATQPVENTEEAPTGGGSTASLAGGACPSGYPIKGNINDAGERIAHSPGQQFYEKTDAEECFTDIAAADASGFRPAQR